MACYLQIENLTKSYGDRILFGDISFGIDEGDKIGIIAKNGTGKSTLLRILAGGESADEGKITPRNGLRIGFLEQLPVFDRGETVLEACLRDAPADGSERWEYENRLKQLLTQLGMTRLDARAGALSGGERKRLALARAIVGDPDLLILDEPTNHLDIEVVEWLENYLGRSCRALLMVTHDRYFLDRVCNKIIEMDDRRIYCHEGNYDYYLRRRGERIEASKAQLDRVRNRLRREQQWMSRQPQARAGKAKYRIEAFHDLKRRSQAGGDDKNVSLEVQSSYIGSKIFEAKGLSKRFGDKVILEDFSYTFARYEKLGIIGGNGAGKSTFVKMLLGIIPPDGGGLQVGSTVKFGYYSQEGISFDHGKKVIDAITEFAEDVVVNDRIHYSPMQFLQHFLFSPADQQKQIGTLSGGERCRLHLATVLMRSPNFLILDEPTNDLDIVTLGILEEYLASFNGCLIVISHDRFFLDSIVDHLFVFEGDGRIKDFPGNYSEYRRWKESDKKAAAKVAAKKPSVARTGAARKAGLSFNERRELQALTTEIEELEAEKRMLDNLFNSSGPIPDIVGKSARYEELKRVLDEKESRWLELSEKES